jgi:acetoin utilization deacetylase AcuC-like enzyme
VGDSGGGALDPDTYVSAGSYRAAMTVAGATVEAVRQIIEGAPPVIMIAARPPGHHAEYGRGMGFCLINNSAVAAQAAIENHGLKKVAIVDWDVHHGNGTQNIFYRRNDVYYISLHQYPFYPGTGASNEIGDDEGEGYTLNFPLAYGTGDEVYLRIFQEKIIPALHEYEPELIIITSGFDAHRDDFLAGMNLTEETYGVMTAMLKETADKFSKGRLLSFFEGGYNPDANGRSLYFHLKGLKGEV